MQLAGYVAHLDTHLMELTRDYGAWTYVILVAIVFCETGLVVMPLLPGDSLLFATGAVAANPESGLNVLGLGAALMVAAIAGDTVNYHIGKYVGPRVLRGETGRFLNKKHLARTSAFFEKHGGKTIIIARFAPIIRTFAPFVAGAGTMKYGRFIAFNVAGGVAWVGAFLAAGFVFGEQKVVKQNFTLLIAAIIVISVMPAAIEIFRGWRSSRLARRLAAAPSGEAPTE